MFEGLFQPMHLLVIFGIALLVFGPKKLPELGKGIGEGIRGFRSAMKEKEEEKPGITAAASTSDPGRGRWRVVFGTEILFLFMLGLLVLGPKRLHTMVRQMACAKGEFEKASRGFKSQLMAELETASQDSTSKR
jgi:sec-independent protein translocase protein TatA